MRILPHPFLHFLFPIHTESPNAPILAPPFPPQSIEMTTAYTALAYRLPEEGNHTWGVKSGASLGGQASFHATPPSRLVLFFPTVFTEP